MSLLVIETNGGRILELEVSGRLVDKDFQSLEPTFYRLLKQHGKIRVLLHMLDFHGWEGAALWDEVRFDLKYFREIERLAMVGDKQWEKFLSALCRPFAPAEIRYFDNAAIDEARAWLEENTT